MAADKAETKSAKTHEGLPRKWKSKASEDESLKKELEKRNVTKYRMLKFFEMQKVERKLNSCRRILLLAKQEKRTEDVDALKLKLKAHLADHEYITYYPKHLPYNALFPKEDSEPSKRRRDEVRKLIEVELAKRSEDAAEGEEVSGSLREGEVVKDTRRASTKAKQQDDANVITESGVAEKTKTNKSKNVKAREKRRLRRNANVTSSSTPSQSLAPAADRERKDVAPLSNDVTALSAQKKKKKKSASSSERNLQVECSNAEADIVTKKRKKRNQDVASLEKNESDKTSRKGDIEPKKKKREHGNEKGRSVDDTLHPSWHGKKSTKISGALVESTGKRQVFESDED